MQPTKILHSVSPSSRAWLARQNSDPYVKKRYMSPTVYRSRSAYKLIEIDDKYKILSNSNVHAVVDLGAAPGGWSQVVAQRLGWDESAKEPPTKLKGYGYGKHRESAIQKHGTWSTPKLVDLKQKESLKRKGKGKSEVAEPDVFDPLNIDTIDVYPNPTVGHGKIVAVDILPMQPIHGVFDFQGDFLKSTTHEQIRQLLSTDPDNPHGKVDVVLSDISPNITGQKMRDTQQSLDVCESVFRFAMGHLRAPEEYNDDLSGVLLVKFFYHQLLQEFCETMLSPRFNDVRIVKPQASRKDSEEAYFLCRGWKGLDDSSMTP
ncbi:hypothetical protein Agabi119p4_10261 [Agaricus bisporus var. burnettii]|uniref:rRNA methyltransferase 2, mitochondrial n=1 Tax=Agaricus bisporus var. burnettii TaxID=192524 RepID=A0A8H7C224_AGABI|nr:hypothetical protein Agabi119p4_10261 [Agaricus bisporus var. burnettii]